MKKNRNAILLGLVIFSVSSIAAIIFVTYSNGSDPKSEYYKAVIHERWNDAIEASDHDCISHLARAYRRVAESSPDIDGAREDLLVAKKRLNRISEEVKNSNIHEISYLSTVEYQEAVGSQWQPELRHRAIRKLLSDEKGVSEYKIYLILCREWIQYIPIVEYMVVYNDTSYDAENEGQQIFEDRVNKVRMLHSSIKNTNIGKKSNIKEFLEVYSLDDLEAKLSESLYSLFKKLLEDDDLSEAENILDNSIRYGFADNTVAKMRAALSGALLDAAKQYDVKKECKDVIVLCEKAKDYSQANTIRTQISSLLSEAYLSLSKTHYHDEEYTKAIESYLKSERIDGFDTDGQYGSSLFYRHSKRLYNQYLTNNDLRILLKSVENSAQSLLRQYSSDASELFIKSIQTKSLRIENPDHVRLFKRQVAPVFIARSDAAVSSDSIIQMTYLFLLGRMWLPIDSSKDVSTDVLLTKLYDEFSESLRQKDKKRIKLIVALVSVVEYQKLDQLISMLRAHDVQLLSIVPHCGRPTMTENKSLIHAASLAA